MFIEFSEEHTVYIFRVEEQTKQENLNTSQGSYELLCNLEKNIKKKKQ
jgi:hypothetical protein